MTDNRQSRMTLALGDERVQFERIEGSEALSTPFTFLIDVRADLEVDLHPYVGTPASVEVREDGAIQRYFHGLIVASEHQTESEAGEQYRLTIQPFTYFLSQNRDMAIFQEMTAVEIIKQIFSEKGISDVEWKTTLKYQKRVYCVQYRESDFAFISRLMEEEGIFYFFRHERDRHVMVIGDAPSAHPGSSPAKLDYVPTSVSVFSTDSGERAGAGKFRLQSWKERVSSGGESRVTLADFDFTTSSHGLSGTHAASTGHARNGVEVYDYPGRYQRDKEPKNEQQDFGTARSVARLEEMRAERRVFTGTSQAGGLAVGTIVSVSGHPAARMNARYLITSTLHAIASETLRSGGKQSEQSFNVRFEAIPADTPYRPPLVTPKPVVQGLESAIVTGPSGETIYTDEYGRVKVQFHWDRRGRRNEQSTCWIRVSQTGLLGNQILPRVGHEVLIDFLHGDPDRPVIVGRVYNESNKPYYKLPDEKTKAVWRTLSYGASGDYSGAEKLDTGEPRANELRFEDKGGHEEVFIHAERDMNVRVRYNETHHVGKDQFIKVGHNRTERVKVDEDIEIGGNRTELVKKDEGVEIQGDQGLTVVGNRTTEVKGQETRTVLKTYKLDVVGKIELICGGSRITMDPYGITVEALNIKVKAGLGMDVNSLMTTMQASAMLTLKGGITLIN